MLRMLTGGKAAARGSGLSHRERRWGCLDAGQCGESSLPLLRRRWLLCPVRSLGRAAAAAPSTGSDGGCVFTTTLLCRRLSEKRPPCAAFTSWIPGSLRPPRWASTAGGEWSQGGRYFSLRIRQVGWGGGNRDLAGQVALPPARYMTRVSRSCSAAPSEWKVRA